MLQEINQSEEKFDSEKNKFLEMKGNHLDFFFFKKKDIPAHKSEKGSIFALLHFNGNVNNELLQF